MFYDWETTPLDHNCIIFSALHNYITLTHLLPVYINVVVHSLSFPLVFCNWFKFIAVIVFKFQNKNKIFLHFVQILPFIIN